MEFIGYALLIFFLSFPVFGIWRFSSSRNVEHGEDFINVSISNKAFHLEVAKTATERNKGLMNRKNLSSDAGMLFVFPTPSIYPFWMKDTYIPLDIIWLNAKKEIVYIKENAKPCKGIAETCKSIVSGRAAKYVIELNAGAVSESKIKVGDTVKF